MVSEVIIYDILFARYRLYLDTFSYTTSFGLAHSNVCEHLAMTL